MCAEQLGVQSLQPYHLAECVAALKDRVHAAMGYCVNNSGTINWYVSYAATSHEAHARAVHASYAGLPVTSRFNKGSSGNCQSLDHPYSAKQPTAAVHMIPW